MKKSFSVPDSGFVYVVYEESLPMQGVLVSIPIPWYLLSTSVKVKVVTKIVRQYGERFRLYDHRGNELTF